MPGLVACNRRWGVGSDDFVFPGCVEFFIRTVWLVTIAAVYGRQKAGFACNYGHLLHVYCIAMLTILSIHLVLIVAMIAVSMRGTIVNAVPRRHLPDILYCKLFMLLPEFAITLLGTLWAFDLESNCDKTVVYAMKATALSGWLVLACLLIGIAVVFDPLGSPKHQQGNIMMEGSVNTAQRLWTLRCKVLCCCVNQDEQGTNAFSDIAQIITDFFKGLDVVVSDVAAGLILVQLEQQKKPLRLRVTPFGNELQQRSQRLTDVVPSSIDYLADDSVFPSPQTWMTLPLAAHYMRFAAASYGWAFYMYTHLCTGAARLYPACRCCTCVRGSTYTMDDNCCNCNTAAIINTTGIKEEDIVYATYYNRIYQIPFFVALDHVEKAVVVSIRGTLSLRDAVTDLSADSEPLEMPGIQEGRAHKGILHAAKYIQQIIIELQLLNKAFEKAPGYQLVITGHSLGAGAASLLAILLRPEYPQLKCFAFSPPGWLVSLPVSRYTEQFICSVVLGVDLVPRLGFLTMENLKSQIIHAIRTANKPKYQILLRGVWNFFKILFGTNTSQQPSPSQSSDRTSLISNHPPRTYTEEQRENDAEGSQDASDHCTLHVEAPLYMPGHVLYIEEMEPARGSCGTPLYRAAWARVEVFDEIIISPKMVHDHLPDVVCEALNQLSNDTSLPEHYAYNVANETAVI